MLTHLHIFRQRIEQIYHVKFKRGLKRNKADIRQTAYYVAYCFNGDTLDYIGKVFSITAEGVAYGVKIQRIATVENPRLYNDIIEIYIESVKEYLNDNRTGQRSTGKQWNYHLKMSRSLKSN